MNESKSIPQAPVFVGEKVTDDRFAKFGKMIVERSYRMPDGKILPFLCAHNPGADPVMVFAITDEKRVFLVNQFRFAIGEFILELPGGNVKPGQTPHDAAREELLAETGVEAREMRIIGGRMPFDPAFETPHFRAMLATGCRVVRHQNLDRTEIIGVQHVSVDELRKMLKKGEITDAKTIATSYLALDHLELLG